MARNLTASFIAQSKRRDGPRPFSVLEVDWLISGTVTPKFYADRPLSGFSHAASAPAAIEASLVLQWPSVSLSLAEGAIGYQNQCSVTLDDTSGALTALLSGSDQQRQLVKIWRMFDDSTCTWGTDNGLILTGVIRPFSWTGKDNQITLNIGDVGPLLAKSMSFPASANIFSTAHNPGGVAITDAYRDKQLPIGWGVPQRVEAICVQKPFQTTINQPTTGVSPITVTIADDPSTMGVDGTGATHYNATLGTDDVTVTFNQSTSPGTSSSTATITTPSNPVIATAILNGTSVGGSPQLILDATYIRPVSMASVLQNFVVNGTILEIKGELIQTSTTVTSLTIDSPWSGWYTITINDPSNTITPNLRPGDTFVFKQTTPAIRAWPIGTILKQTGVNFIYIVSALPSRLICRIEGYGTISDQAGPGKKDFVILGEYTEIIISGSSITTLTGNMFTVNLNDNTWNNPAGTLLGQNVTTLSIPNGRSPRDLNPALDDDRLWVCSLGVEDHGDSTGNVITNPALIILQYLENTHLMNVSAGSINATSFANAASALAGYDCGFGQIEAEDGLALLQQIAANCHSVLFFDQGQANMVVLSDSPGTTIWTGDTTTNDNLLQGQLSVSESAVDDVINDLTFNATVAWDDKTGAKPLQSKDVRLTSISAFGRMAKSMDCKIYFRRQDVFTELEWWLNHLSSIFRYVTFTAFLDALILQPGDTISVTWVDGSGHSYFGGAQLMQVTRCVDTGRDGLVQIEARYVVFSYS